MDTKQTVESHKVNVSHHDKCNSKNTNQIGSLYHLNSSSCLIILSIVAVRTQIVLDALSF
jgi:hypothetical protein